MFDQDPGTTQQRLKLTNKPCQFLNKARHGVHDRHVDYKKKMSIFLTNQE